MAKHYTRDWGRTPNGRPRNPVFTVLPYIYSGYYDEYPEQIELKRFEVTVATLDGVRVAYTSKRSKQDRKYGGVDGYKNVGEATVFYAVGVDGKPNPRYSVAAGEGRGDWRIYHDDDPYDNYYNRRDALHALASSVRDDDSNGGRTDNPRGDDIEYSVFSDAEGAWGRTDYHEHPEYFGVYVKMFREKFLRIASKLEDGLRNPAVAKHMAAGGKIATPALYVKIPWAWEKGDFSEMARVAGHEGRNRMSALREHTIENVFIVPWDGMRARHLTKQMLEEISRAVYAESSYFGEKSTRIERNNFVSLEPLPQRR